MKTRLRLRIVAFLIGVAASHSMAFANFGPPFPRSKQDVEQSVPFTIQEDSSWTMNRLVIPRKFLKNSKSANTTSRSKSRMIIGGIALSLSVLTSVFLLLRKRNPAAKWSTAALVLGITGLFVSDMASAEVAEPITEIPKHWKLVGKDKQQVIIKVTEKGDTVQLILGTSSRVNPIQKQLKREGTKPSVPNSSTAKQTGSKASKTPPSKPRVDP